MGTRTTQWGGNAMERYFRTPLWLDIQLDPQEYPTGTISLNLSMSANPVRAWINSGSNSRKIDFYLCDSAGNNAIKLFSSVSTPSGIYMTDTPNTVTIDNTSAKTLKGASLYVKSIGVGTGESDSAYFGTYGLITMTINTANAATAVTKGNKILATDRSQIGTATTAGEVMTDPHFARGTLIEASTFNSQVLGL